MKTTPFRLADPASAWGRTSGSAPCSPPRGGPYWPLPPPLCVSGTAARLAKYVADRYTLERSLGAGAAGEVFLARDLRSGAPVALKVLSEHHDDGTMSARFRREIEICRRLAHPGIVGVVDAGSAGDSLYYAMPYVEGRSLRDRL